MQSQRWPKRYTYSYVFGKELYKVLTCVFRRTVTGCMSVVGPRSTASHCTDVQGFTPAGIPYVILASVYVCVL